MTASQYPLVAFYDENGKPIKLAEATSIVVNSVSAATYQNLPSTGGGISQADADVRYVNVSGDTMTGTLTVPDVNVNYIDFEVAANPDHDEGRVVWNDDYKTLEIDTANQTSYLVGQEISIRVLNNTQNTIGKGTIVYITGYDSNQGGIATIDVATNTSESQTHKGLGVLKQRLTAGQRGLMMVYGVLRGTNETNGAFDTGAFSEGSIVYLGADGALTATMASEPNHPEIIGTILNSDATLGSIFVHVQHGYELNEIHDVDRDMNPTTGQVLTFAAGGYWTAQTPAAGGTSYTSNPANEASVGVWQRSSPGLDDYYVNRSVATAANQVLMGTANNTISIVTAPGTNHTYLGYDGGLSPAVAWRDPIARHTNTGITPDPHTQYVLNTNIDNNEIVYRTNSGSFSSINAAVGDNGKYLKYNSTGPSYSWDAPPGSTLSKSVTIANPSTSENIGLFHVDKQMTVAKIVAVLRGDSGPGVTFEINQASSRTASSPSTVLSSVTVTSTTTGSTYTSFNNATLSAGNFVWLVTTGASGTNVDFNVTMHLTQ